MSGHNKWSQIREKKGKTDAAKSRAFSKFAKLITTEARLAGGNKDSPALKAAIERAKRENMPNDNIERAIKRATESKEAMESITYEAYGPGGAALIIEALTDNRNRAAQEVKRILSEHGGNLAAPGAAMWAFAKEPQTNNYRPTAKIPLSDEDAEKMGGLVEALEESEEVQEVFTNAE